MSITSTAGPAAAQHDGMAAAYHAQRERFAGQGDMWSGCAGSFKPDLNAPEDAFRAMLAGFVQPDDVLLDVGGGAGRLSLPLAKRCREVICIDPSRAMAEVFEATVREADIANARFVRGSWPDVDNMNGDVSLVGHVTYFVRQIAPFIDRLNGATRRRVVIATRSLPPPNHVAPFFELLHGEKFAPVPAYDALLDVLREMRIEAELIDAGDALPPATAPFGKTPEEAANIQVEGGVRLGWVPRADIERLRSLIANHFDELYAATESGYRPRVSLGARELFITWETGR